jgi:prepilin-type N-terminal cleavage/methylation domain-containing protein
MRKGFTLIELMIVIAIIAIIAAIAIPNLLSGRMSANETSALGTLKQITSTEAIWLQQGPDGNGVKDYWVYDVSCFHRMYRADGASKVAFVPLDVAKADAAPADITNEDLFGTPVKIETWTATGGGITVVSAPKSGYWFHAMFNNNLDGRDDPTPTAYAINRIGDGTIEACNNNQYGFMAAPDVYASSGIRSFIVNEAGTVYATDTGAENTDIGPGFGSAAVGDVGEEPTGGKKWQTDGVGGDLLNWPTSNPPSRTSGSGKPWEVAE